MQENDFEKMARDKQLVNTRKFSQLSGLKTGTLIFYDREGVLKPAVRDPFTQWRYYAPQQLVTAKFIQQCTYWDIHLSEIKEMLAERSPESFRQFLSAQRRLVIEQLQIVKEQLATMNVYAELIDEGMIIDENEICIRKMGAQRLRMGGENDFKKKANFYEALSVFLNEMPIMSRHLPVVGYFPNDDLYFATPTQPTKFAIIDPTGQDERPAGKYLVGYARGYFGQRTNLPERIKEYADDHDVKFGGGVYKIYLHDEMCVEEPNQYLYQVLMSVKE